jgi:7,8-dihydroneopterin aldolase/epimerase/oxygenase
MAILGTIALRQLEFFGYHGYYQEERRIGNRYSVDIAADYEIGEAGHTDQLSKTLNYERLVAIATQVMGEPAYLLENLALTIAERIRAEFPYSQSIRVTVSKHNPPLGVLCEAASVSVAL